MPLVRVIKPYKFAHAGIHVEEFEPAEGPIETTDECAAQGVEDGAFELPAQDLDPDKTPPKGSGKAK